MLREKISLSSRTLRCWEKNLALVSNPEMLRKKSRSRLELWDLKKKILVLVSNLEIESNFFWKVKGQHFIYWCCLQGSGRPSSQLGRLMRRMMAPTMTLDTISKIRMVLAVWLMVMRIARWAVFSVQMSFESFRIGTIYLKSRDIVTAKVFLHQVAPGLLQVVAHLPQVVLHHPHVGLQELHHLPCHYLNHLLALLQPLRHPDSNWSDLWSRWISQKTWNWFPQKSSNISSAFFPFRMQIIRNRFKFWLCGGWVKTLMLIQA